MTTPLPKPKTPEALADYVRDLIAEVNGRPTDAEGAATAEAYEAAADALWKAAAAAFEHVASALAVTGYQGSWAALRFYSEVMRIDGPFRVVQAHDALFPQYDLVGDLDRWLTSGPVAEWLRDQAITKLADQQAGTRSAAPGVVAHWRRLARREVRP